MIKYQQCSAVLFFFTFLNTIALLIINFIFFRLSLCVSEIKPGSPLTSSAHHSMSAAAEEYKCSNMHMHNSAALMSYLTA